MTTLIEKTITIKLTDNEMENDELNSLMVDLEKYINYHLGELAAKTTRHFGLWVRIEIK